MSTFAEPEGAEAHDVDDRRLEVTEEYAPEVVDVEEYEAEGDSLDDTGDNAIVDLDEPDL